MRSSSERHLDWDGCFNVRDLGGLPTANGCETRWGAVVRADALDQLTQTGWTALVDHGVRTIIDLRNDDELGADTAPRPPSTTTIRLALDCVDDTEFWNDWWDGPQFATPLYYGPHLERFPQASSAVLGAIAAAPPGGVVVHCAGGRDRTGQITILLLTLVGVAADAVAADYDLSDRRLAARYAARGEEDPAPGLEAFLAEQGTTASELIARLINDLDIETMMGAAGLSDDDIAALRERLAG